MIPRGTHVSCRFRYSVIASLTISRKDIPFLMARYFILVWMLLLIRKLQCTGTSVVSETDTGGAGVVSVTICIRTFFLVVLAILGPIAFAISVWDGFQSTLTQWICRYIQVYLWLPVSDMFSTILAKIQVLMLQSDIERMQADPNFSLDSSDGVYIVFMIIGIIGYFTIPTVAGWIIQAGGMGSYGRNVNQTAGRAGSMAGSVAGAAAGNVVGRAGKLLK